MTWEAIQREMPGQILHGQDYQRTGKIYSVFYNMDATWTIYESTRESRSEADIREVGTYNANQFRHVLHELGLHGPLDWADLEKLELPYIEQDEELHFKKH